MALGQSCLAKAAFPSRSSEEPALLPVRKSPVTVSCSEPRGRKEFVSATPRTRPKISKKLPPAASCHPRKPARWRSAFAAGLVAGFFFVGSPAGGDFFAD